MLKWCQNSVKICHGMFVNVPKISDLRCANAFKMQQMWSRSRYIFTVYFTISWLVLSHILLLRFFNCCWQHDIKRNRTSYSTVHLLYTAVKFMAFYNAALSNFSFWILNGNFVIYGRAVFHNDPQLPFRTSSLKNN